MLVVVSPTPRRMLIELAVGRDAYILDRRYAGCIMPPPRNGTADRASDLIAAAAVLEYLETTKAPDAPEAGRLKDRIRGLVAELITVQNDDGGFPWVAGPRGAKAPSDRMTSVRATWAFARRGRRRRWWIPWRTTAPPTTSPRNSPRSTPPTWRPAPRSCSA